jgi:hypothetical protein
VGKACLIETTRIWRLEAKQLAVETGLAPSNREPICRGSAIDGSEDHLPPDLRAFAMSETERSNLLHALDLRHDEALESLAELDRQVEAAIALIRPPAAVETPAPTSRKKASAA